MKILIIHFAMSATQTWRLLRKYHIEEDTCVLQGLSSGIKIRVICETY
jgi:hypothetical protein